MPQPAIEYAHNHSSEFVNQLKELLAIPSISTLPQHSSDMERAAVWLTDYLNASGLEAELIPEGRHPLVYAEWLGAPGAPTVLVYGHYDVQPVDPIDLWQTPPFEPTVRNGSMFARGASDDKGQTLASLCAARSIMATHGRLPINLKFLIEGQEECGGAIVKQYVSEHGDRLSADTVQIADGHMFAAGLPTLETGLRGIVYAEIHAEGPSHDLHSGLYGGVAPNPLIALSQIIADLKDREGHITIPGFYADVEMPDNEIRSDWKRLPFDENEFLRDEIGSTQLVGETQYEPLERIWARPTLDVHGILGGFTGEGAKTVIPSRASAKISMRLVPNQRTERIFTLFKQRVLALAPPGIRLDVQLIHGDDPVLVPDRSPVIEVAREALQRVFGRPAILGRSGGSIPIVGVFKQLLGLETLLMGWGLPDDNLHAPNEKFSLECFRQGIDATIAFWTLLGQRGLERDARAAHEVLAPAVD